MAPKERGLKATKEKVLPATKRFRCFAPVIASLWLAVALAVPAESGATLSDVVSTVPVVGEGSTAVTPTERRGTDSHRGPAPTATEVAAPTATEVAPTSGEQESAFESSYFFGCGYDSVLRTLFPAYEAPFKAFSLFADEAWYAPIAQGDFERMPTWSKGGSVSLVNPSNPFALNGTMGQSSLRLRSGGWVRTPLMCVNLLTPHLRFVAKASGYGGLDVEARLIGCRNQFISSSSTTLWRGDHSAWAPSKKIDLNTSCLGPGRTGVVDVRFRSEGDWLIDDVMIDPYKRG